MSTKLKINLSEGKLEVEGSEKFVNSIYKDFKHRLGNIQNAIKARQPASARPKAPGPKAKSSKSTTSQSGAAKSESQANKIT
jgi:hypothetical protein